ncbi:hypothetical protein EV368DRAFT_87721 [Lentinula lateritia]|nr:hypothetical protein EV368DRAFT_87721 [Lentinula lateritia]
MTTSHTITTTTTNSSNTATGPSSAPSSNPPTANPTNLEGDNAEEEEKKKAAQEAREWAVWAQSQEEELAAWRRQLANMVTARGQWKTSPRRLVVELMKMTKNKRKGKARVEPVGRDPDNGNDGDSGNGGDDNKEDGAPCKWCHNNKISCQMQAGKRSSIICKPCHDAKVRCLYSGQPMATRREGSGERMAVMESQMAQGLTNLWALWEPHLGVRPGSEWVLRLGLV